jgi:hypothetical protein
MARELCRSESKGIKTAMSNATDGSYNGKENENVGSKQNTVCSIE